MNRILVLFAHPALEKSRINRRLVRQVPAGDGVTLHDLYEVYPDYDLDVAREQALLLAHDVVVFQHPFYWYSVPPILKQWQDLVLEHGWAYGHGGTRLHGKWVLHALTAGGRQQAYGPTGYNRFTVRELLAPLEQTARLCGMRFLPPYVVHGTHRMEDADIEREARRYGAFLAALRDGRIDLEAAERMPSLETAVAHVGAEVAP